MATECEEAQKYKRYHHTDLQPLTTTHVTACHPISSSPSTGHDAPASPPSSCSAISLASPSLAAVRKYYRDHGLRTAFQTQSSPKEHRVYISEGLPRRQSILSPGGLATRMERIAISSPVNSARIEQVRDRLSIAEVSREMLLDGVNSGELARLGSVFSRRLSSPHSSILSSVSARISSKTNHDRLRAWGPAYLGNTAVADVYVKAVQLRISDQAKDSSKFNVSEQGGPSGTFDHPTEGIVSTTNSKVITVRARVLPRAKERRPFLIQRRFNLEEMRASAPISKAGAKEVLGFLPNNDGGKETEYLGTKIPPERSKSDSSSKPLKMHAESKPPILPYDHIPAAKVSGTAGRKILVMPIREYICAA